MQPGGQVVPTRLPVPGSRIHQTGGNTLDTIDTFQACDPSPDGSDVSRSTKPPKAGEMEGAFGSAPEAIFTILQSVYFYHLPVLSRPELPGANRNNRRLDASHSGIGTAIDASLGLR